MQAVPMSGSTTTSPTISSTGPSAGKSVCIGVVHAKAARAAAHLEKPRQIKNHGELGEFGRLQAQRAQANPAMRRVRPVEKKYARSAAAA